jgi:hypothetical protein
MYRGWVLAFSRHLQGKQETLRGAQERPSVCDLVLPAKLFISFSENSVSQFRTKRCGKNESRDGHLGDSHSLLQDKYKLIHALSIYFLADFCEKKIHTYRC